ncbi:MAG: flagellar hook-length control protein FliK [Geminicoccaceae bacterium]|nr:flagellar hook-length control protein FliK [Geminicoccaceae bacterium]
MSENAISQVSSRSLAGRMPQGEAAAADPLLAMLFANLLINPGRVADTSANADSLAGAGNLSAGLPLDTVVDTDTPAAAGRPPILDRAPGLFPQAMGELAADVGDAMNAPDTGSAHPNEIVPTKPPLVAGVVGNPVVSTVDALRTRFLANSVLPVAAPATVATTVGTPMVQVPAAVDQALPDGPQQSLTEPPVSFDTGGNPVETAWADTAGDATSVTDMAIVARMNISPSTTARGGDVVVPLNDLIVGDPEVEMISGLPEAIKASSQPSDTRIVQQPVPAAPAVDDSAPVALAAGTSPTVVPTAVSAVAPLRDERGGPVRPIPAVSHVDTRPVQMAELPTRSERMSMVVDRLPPASGAVVSTMSGHSAGSSYVPEVPVERTGWMRAFSPEASDPVAGTSVDETADSPDAVDFDLGEFRPVRESGALHAERVYARTQLPLPPSVQIAQQLVQATQDGVGRLRIQLHPEELGGVDIDVSFDHERKVSVSISVERPETLDLLQRESRHLERLLGQHGLAVDNGLDLAMQQNRSNGQQGGHGHREQRGGFAGHLDELPKEATPVSAAAVAMPVLVTNGLYDLTI